MAITYGQAYSSLSKDIKTLKINGIIPVFRKNKMTLSRSILSNLPRVLRDFSRWREINKEIKQFSPDLFITDFEPLTARLAGYNECPLISINNQHVLLQDIPKETKKNHLKDFLISELGTYFCTPKAEAFIILSLTETKLSKRNSFLISPIIKEEIRKAKPQDLEHVLVYLSKPDDQVINTLKKIPQSFIVYGYDKELKVSNIVFKKNNVDFISNLATSKAVIGTAGFSLISESIFLKKPYFAIPHYHFEQELNAFFVKKLKIGLSSKNPSQKEIETFIENLPKYKTKLKTFNFNHQKTFKTIDLLIKQVAKPRALVKVG